MTGPAAGATSGDGDPVAAGPGYAKGRAKRREILERATALFGEVGYRGTSLREVAARCGLSHTGLLHHFRTKEALLQAVLEQRDADDAPRVRPATGDPLDALRGWVDVVAFNAGRRAIVELFCVLAAEATSPLHPAHPWLAARYADTLGSLTTVYADAARTGALRPGVDPEAAARQLVALVDGLQIQWLLDDRIDMAAVVRDHIAAQLTIPL